MKAPTFEELWASHRRVARGIVRRFARRREDREDLEQLARVRAWKAHARYDPSRPFDVWLSRIVWRACADWARVQPPETPVGLDFVFTLASREPSPLDVALRRETMRLADAAFEAFSPRQRVAVRLVARGESLRTIGRELGTSETAARSLVLHARRKASRLLA